MEMNAVACLGPGSLKIIKRVKPELKKGQAIIRVRRVGICGTDIHAFEGTQPYFTYPRVLGHELAGELVAADDAPGFSEGEIVTVLPYWNCGHCIACRKGKPNCCVELRVCGVHVDGGMTEYFSVPCESLVHGNGLALDELAMVEPLSIGAHGVRRAAIAPGEFVLIVGAGPIGLGIMQFCKIAGANVTAMDINDQRLEFARRNIGIEHVVNSSRGDAVEQIKRITNNDMATGVFDATGSQRAINAALPYLAHGGRYVLVGLQKGDISLSHPEFHKRETTLMSSRNAFMEDFDFVIACIKAKKVDTKAFVTHRLLLGNLEHQFNDLIKSRDLVVKAMVNVE